jgi:hypothetical protein
VYIYVYILVVHFGIFDCATLMYVKMCACYTYTVFMNADVYDMPHIQPEGLAQVSLMMPVGVRACTNAHTCSIGHPWTMLQVDASSAFFARACV